MTKRAGSRNLQRVGGWCEPMVSASNGLSLPSRRAESVRASRAARDCYVKAKGLLEPAKWRCRASGAQFEWYREYAKHTRLKAIWDGYFYLPPVPAVRPQLCAGRLRNNASQGGKRDGRNNRFGIQIAGDGGAYPRAAADRRLFRRGDGGEDRSQRGGIQRLRGGGFGFELRFPLPLRTGAGRGCDRDHRRCIAQTFILYADAQRQRAARGACARHDLLQPGCIFPQPHRRAAVGACGI